MSTEEVLKLFYELPISEQWIFLDMANPSTYHKDESNTKNDYEMNLHQHWKENEGDNHSGTIKHFQD